MINRIAFKIRGNENKTILTIVCITVAFLIPDTMINYVTDFITPQLISPLSIFFFITIVAVYSVSQYFILDYVKHKSKEIRAKDQYLKFINVIIPVVQYSLVAIMVFVVSEILFSSSYQTILLIITNNITGVLTISIMSLFALRFFSWYKANKNSLVVLLYALSFALSALGLVLILINETYPMLDLEPTRTAASEVIFPSDVFEPGSFLANLFESFQYINTAAFVLLMAGTAFLLHHYANKIGRLKFWIVISLPIVYRVISELQNFGAISLTTDAELFYYYLFTSLNSSAGGILFGIAFWTIAKTIRQDSPVRQYMMIAVYGFVLHFISNQVTLSAASYPPYGLATIIALPLSAYMIFIGVYSTAISVSQDMRLRQSIRKIATKDTNLLSSIGTAQMEQEIERTVNGLKDVVQEQEKELEEQTGIEANMEEDEMKKYLEQVMQEVGKTRTQK